MYDIIFLIISLLIVLVISYQIMKKYKKNKKEGFTIAGQATNSLSTSSINDTTTYISQLTTIISNLKLSLNLEANRESYIQILELQNELIQLCLLNKFLNFNLNYSDDFLLYLSETTLKCTESNSITTGATVALGILDTTGNNTTTQSILSSLFT